MKTLIATFGHCVSPRFDCATEAISAEITDRAVTHREHIRLDGTDPARRVSWVIQQGYQAVVCGAIDRLSAEMLMAAGIALTPWVTGPADRALGELAGGRLLPATDLGVEGRCRGHWTSRCDFAAPVRGQGCGRRRGRRRGC